MTGSRGGKLHGRRREPTIVGRNVHDDRVVVVAKHREKLPKLGSAGFVTTHGQEFDSFWMSAREVHDVVVHRPGLGAKMCVKRRAVERHSARDIVTP